MDLKKFAQEMRGVLSSINDYADRESNHSLSEKDGSIIVEMLESYAVFIEDVKNDIKFQEQLQKDIQEEIETLPDLFAQLVEGVKEGSVTAQSPSIVNFGETVNNLEGTVRKSELIQKVFRTDSLIMHMQDDIGEALQEMVNLDIEREGHVTGMTEQILDVLNYELLNNKTVAKQTDSKTISETKTESVEQNVSEKEAEGSPKKTFKELTLKFGKGYVGKEFQGKDGTAYKEIRVPNSDKSDKRPWQTFVAKANHVHENQYAEGMWLKLPAEGHTTLYRKIVTGENPDGTKKWDTEKTRVSNADLKKMMEKYKERPKESIKGRLAEKKEQTAEQKPVEQDKRFKERDMR